MQAPNKSVINYTPKCTYHLLYEGGWCKDINIFYNEPLDHYNNDHEVVIL